MLNPKSHLDAGAVVGVEPPHASAAGAPGPHCGLAPPGGFTSSLSDPSSSCSNHGSAGVKIA